MKLGNRATLPKSVMQTRQRRLSGSTARSEGSPVKYLGIENIAGNKEEMLALLPLASFYATSSLSNGRSRI